MSYDAAFDWAVQLVGMTGGDLFDIWRPDYTGTTGSLTLVASSVQFRTDPTSAKFAEPDFREVSYYDVFGPKYLIKSGDILKKSVPDGMTPPVTITTFMPLKAVMAVRTARIGRIMNAIKLADGTPDPNPVYDNVYFDFLGEQFPGSAINRNLEESLRIPNTRVVIYNRVNVSRQNMHFIEIDLQRVVTLPSGLTQPFQKKWIIDAIDYTPPLMVLTLRGA